MMRAIVWTGLSFLLIAASASAGIVGVRWFSAPDHTRIVLDLDEAATYEIREVDDPPRLAVNLPRIRFDERVAPIIDDGLVKGLRCNQNRRRAQLVIDLEAPAACRHFFLRAEPGRPPRVVVDVLRPAAAEPAVVVAPEPDDGDETVTVVLDPGHGGLDPGAIRGRDREKDIVLDVTRKLAGVLRRHDRVEVVLTRDGDWYPSLGDRVQKAMTSRGDLFVSIHCNTHASRAVAGMEVYFLSLQGATDSEAQELADKENAADLVGLAAGDQADDVVLSILMDLHAGRILHESHQLSAAILEAAVAEDLATRRVKQARFQVLRSLAMPSALVELAYLTNPDDRRLLTTEAGRQTLAEAVASGILAYLDREEPEVLAVAPAWTRHYKVRRGDTLWSLSRRHGTTVTEIRRRNNLRNNRVQAGQYLSLPEGQPTS